MDPLLYLNKKLKKKDQTLKIPAYKNSLVKLAHWYHNDKHVNFKTTINVLPVWISLVLGPEHREEQAKEDGHKS